MELRAGYKQSEVGVIPEDWEVAPVRQIAAPTRNAIVGGPFGSDLVAADYVEKGVPVIRGQNMGGPSVSGEFVFVTPAKAHSLESNLARTGDLVFTQRGTVGQISLIASGPFGRYLISQSQMKLSANRAVTDASFLYYLFTGEHHQALIKQETIQTGVPHINLGILRGFPVQLPPKLEQHAIATALSDVDALLAGLDRMIAKKRDLKQAAMQQLLTGRTRLPGYAKNWEKKTIEQLEQANHLHLSRGKVISKKDIALLPGDFPIYSSSVKDNGLFGSYGESMFDEELITWSVDGGGHFFHRSKHKFSVTNVCGYMRADTRKINYLFLAAQLQFLHSMLSFDYQDKAHPSIIRKAYRLSLPELEEQTAIATVLSDIDAEIAALETRRDKTRQLKQGMMQALLTGRIRLV